MAVTFQATVRRWREDKPGGLAITDRPDDRVGGLGGRRQMRLTGTLNDAEVRASTMVAAGGSPCLGVSKAVLNAAGVGVGDTVRPVVEPDARHRRGGDPMSKIRCRLRS